MLLRGSGCFGDSTLRFEIPDSHFEPASRICCTSLQYQIFVVCTPTRYALQLLLSCRYIGTSVRLSPPIEGEAATRMGIVLDVPLIWHMKHLVHEC